MAFTKKITNKITYGTKENLLTRPSTLFKRERRGDSQRVIANRLTSQQAIQRVQFNGLTGLVQICLAQRCKLVFNAIFNAMPMRTRPDLTRIYLYQSFIKTAINTAITVKLLTSKVTLLRKVENDS